ncbi:hypothetical protein [Burkholderia sp. SCN-KJ]|uniref:hypothetical protein n=1 Tax=Burkholderia sp. SCN-KJ TaxID=2969248 RepID=UPI00214FEC68|nr:hypothetical protein [Burkholderia sp. SCN-KJ]MCR4465748.1 hypothetical protein [Burkholderia sp. SCN-KJ]
MQGSNESQRSRVRLLKGILPIRRASAIRDVFAGISLASMDIPQVLGYARIAGMPGPNAEVGSRKSEAGSRKPGGGRREAGGGR